MSSDFATFVVVEYEMPTGERRFTRFQFRTQASQVAATQAFNLMGSVKVLEASVFQCVPDMFVIAAAPKPASMAAPR